MTPVTPTAPTFNSGTDTITIPSVTGVVYSIGGVTQAAGPVVITEDTTVTAAPASGYGFTPGATTSWSFVYVP